MATKSILKKTKGPSLPGSNDNDNLRQKNYELAVHHATLIQNRKEAEAKILDAIEVLIDFPTQTESSATSPAAEDILHFRQLILPFQSSDFDDLIEERYAANICGYVFCKNATRHSVPGSQRIIWGSSKDSTIKTIPSKTVETWCSNDCARRAMYIKAQLSEVPAWERSNYGANKIEILGETSTASPASRVIKLDIEKDSRSGRESELKDLARERGEPGISKPKLGVMSEELAESRSIKAPKPPSVDGSNGLASHTLIEGHAPKFGVNEVTSNMRAMTMDENDSDWELD